MGEGKEGEKRGRRGKQRERKWGEEIDPHGSGNMGRVEVAHLRAARKGEGDGGREGGERRERISGANISRHPMIYF